MKLETVKSFTLVVLIGISLILSFSLWSYQPNSDRTLGGEIETVEMDVGGSSEESKGSMIKPTDIIFHTLDEYYGFVEASDQDALFSAMQDWVITNFELTTGEDIYTRSGSGVELIFPDEIPMEVMNSIFTFGSEDDVLPTWSVNRIFIHFEYDSKSLHLEFISNENNRVSTAVINDTEAFEALLAMVDNINGETLRRYLAINEDTQPVYFPAEPVNLPTYSIPTIDINPGLFVNILFDNPSVVRETTTQSIGETYFTDSRQMSVYYDRMRMEYRNHATSPTSEEEITITELDLIERSIANINSHSGWNEDYRLEELNLSQKLVSYRLHFEGYPIINNYKLSKIEQRWDVFQNGGYHLLEYDRPLYSFGIELSLSEVDHLESGENIIAYLQNNPDVVIENIQDIMVSYELTYQHDEQGSEYIELEPSWFKKENNTWQKIVLDEHSSPKGAE